MVITCFGCGDGDTSCNDGTSSQDEKENTLWELHFLQTDSGRFHYKMYCVHLKFDFISLQLSKWDILLHGLHINSWLKSNLATFPLFATHLTFLSVHHLGLKNSGPSALNDERQNLLLCTSATAILFWYCNETERAVCVRACVCVVSSLSNG